MLSHRRLRRIRREGFRALIARCPTPPRLAQGFAAPRGASVAPGLTFLCVLSLCSHIDQRTLMSKGHNLSRRIYLRVTGEQLVRWKGMVHTARNLRRRMGNLHRQVAERA
jgi:hypothetical protein